MYTIIYTNRRKPTKEVFNLYSALLILHSALKDKPQFIDRTTPTTIKGLSWGCVLFNYLISLRSCSNSSRASAKTFIAF